jgi:glycosyltransferase involved in cell wall biosynthesis
MKTESQSIEQISKVPQPPRLPKPVKITEQVWSEGTVPVVSIWCITYNHVNFIRDAIEGFLMQETTFSVEIFIHDDASTDGTAEVIKEYAEKYPKLFWTVLQKENQWSKGNKKILWDYLAQQRGEFVALCEGDDYWTSSHKLQKQVELLESDANASGTFHEVSMVCQDSGRVLDVRPRESDPAQLVFDDIAERNPLFTCCLVYRRSSCPSVPLWAAHLAMGDWPLKLTLCEHGYLVKVAGNMAVYRRHAGGVWSSSSVFRETLGVFRFHEAVLKSYSDRNLARAKARMKQEALKLFSLSIEGARYSDARRYLWSYLLLPPRRFTLPPLQKKNIAKVFIPWCRQRLASSADSVKCK